MNARVSHQKTAAMTLVEVLVVIAVIAVLVAMLLPATTGHRPPMRSRCIMNLKQIAIAHYVWANDHNGKFPMQVSVTNGGTLELMTDGKNSWLNYLVMSNELVTPRVLVCPADKDRVATTDFTNGLSAKNVSYFTGLDANTNHPQMFLSGDDNFAISGVPVKSGLLEFPTNAPITWTAERHMNTGNIGLVDGSVVSVTDSGLVNLLHQTGVATNRLAIP